MIVTVGSALFSVADSIWLAHWTGASNSTSSSSSSSSSSSIDALTNPVQSLAASALSVGLAPSLDWRRLSAVEVDGGAGDFGVTDGVNSGGESVGGLSQTQNLLVYVGIGCTGELLAAMQTLALTICALRASRKLHGTVLARLLRAPMLFFDSTPSGAVLNRFLSDMQNIDSAVPDR